MQARLASHPSTLMALFWLVNEVDGRVLISARAARRVALPAADLAVP
jgi:hypothetical protein